MDSDCEKIPQIQQYEKAPSKKTKDWFQITAILIGSLTSFTCGIFFGWPSPAIPQIISDKTNYNITLEEASYFTVLPPVASLLSSFLFSRLNDVIGRKFTLLSMVLPHSMAWILISIASSKWVLYAARTFSGIGDACLFSTLPVYISEIATPSVRGTWGNSMTFFIYFGQFVVNVVGSFWSVRQSACIFLVVPVIFGVCFMFMPETPYYLVAKGRFDDARTSLKRLRRISDVGEELAMIKHDVERQLSESGTWKDLFCIESNRKALYAGIFLRASQQLGGIGVFIVYTQYIFQKSGGNVSPQISSIIVTALCCSTNFLASFTIERLGRKKSYLYSVFLCGIVLSIEFIYFYIDQLHPDINLDLWRWVPLAGMMTYIVLFGFGMGIVPTLMLGELFSQSIKGKGLCIMNIVFGVMVSSVTKIFQVLETNVGMYLPFLLFALSCFISTAMTLFLVPETKGRTLEEIQQDLKGNKTKKLEKRISLQDELNL